MLKKIFYSLILLVIFFYTIYPQALAFRGSSIVSLTGLIGLGLFFSRGEFFDETKSLFMGMLPMLICAALAGIGAGYFDGAFTGFIRSQIAWIFASYLTVYCFFKLFPKGDTLLFIYFIIGALFLQAVISIIMEQNPNARVFFESLQMQTDLSGFIRDKTEGSRLNGYGVAFFGAGIIAGVGLILIIYAIF